MNGAKLSATFLAEATRARCAPARSARTEWSSRNRLVNDLDASWGETVTADLGIPSYETLLGMLAIGR